MLCGGVWCTGEDGWKSLTISICARPTRRQRDTHREKAVFYLPALPMERNAVLESRRGVIAEFAED